jgi:hypothetical protein
MQGKARVVSEPREKNRIVDSLLSPIAPALGCATERPFRISAKSSGKCFPLRISGDTYAPYYKRSAP